MEPLDRERVSRVLEAVLASLKAETRTDQRTSLTSVTSIELPSNDAPLSGAPVVILIHPNEGISNESATQVEKPDSCGCSDQGSAVHPGFERFELSKSDTRDPSKMCFIEPDRVCVGSGACETRGY
jgi:hypothetical protein